MSDVKGNIGRKALRVPELDLLRFIAAALVVIYHYTYRKISGDGADALMFPVLSAVTKYGYLGVDLFFLLSGFVIFFSAASATPKSFAISRVSRLYPTFWVCMVFSAIVVVVFGGHADAIGFKQLLGNATMLAGYMGVDYVDGVYWTLQVEIKFYLLVFALLIARQMSRAEMFLFLWLALTLAERFIYNSSALKSLLVTEYAGYFIAGALFYLVRAEGITPYRLIALLLCALVSSENAYSQASGFIFAATPQECMVSALLVFVSFLLVGAIAMQWIRVRASRVLFNLGALTYPLYLLHNEAGKILINLGARWSLPLAVVLVAALMLLLSYVVANVFDAKVRPKFQAALSAISF
jgi:peptidoglycan/LPS O-acetylase OafA/YrhL